MSSDMRTAAVDVLISINWTITMSGINNRY